MPLAMDCAPEKLTMRWTTFLVLCTAAAFTGCGGSTSAGSGGAAGSGTGGAGGSSGTAGAGDGGKVCTPMPGCSSTTTCSDGCNTCSCFNGEWACTERACPPDAGRSDAGQGVCDTDSDCIFRPESGCCGVCLAKTDPIPPHLLCGVLCPAAAPGCVCIDHKCGTGNVQAGQSCQQAHNLCSYGLMCCEQCGGPFIPDAQSCSVCTQPVFIGGMPGCPPPPP